MSTTTETQADRQELLRAVVEGRKVDPDVSRRVEERANKARNEMRRRGLTDVAAVSDTLGWVYYRKNLPQLALPPLLKAVKAEPLNAEFHYHLGATYAATGDKVKARHALTQALELKLGANDAKHARTLLESL